MFEIFLKDGLYKKKRGAPTCVDLFSGAGGLSVGFAMAGGVPVGAVDIDSDSIATYRKTFPNAKFVSCSPIHEWSPNLRKGDVDVVIGGPPCQGFSLARGLRFVDDPRNHLYKEFVRIVSQLRPKWIVMENVEGITNIGQGQVLKQIFEDFELIGYNLECKIVNMAQFGVPQLRKRAIFVGKRDGGTFNWPNSRFFDSRKKNPNVGLFESDSHPFQSVNSALSDLVLPQGNYFSHRANSQMRGPRNRDAHNEPAFTLRVRGDEFALCELPASSAFIPGPVPSECIEFREPQNSLQEMLRYHAPNWVKLDLSKKNSKKKPSNLIGTRRLSIREQARLQTFPDWVTFEGRVTSQAKQIGNAVPPVFSFQLFREIFQQT